VRAECVSRARAQMVACQVGRSLAACLLVGRAGGRREMICAPRARSRARCTNQLFIFPAERSSASSAPESAGLKQMGRSRSRRLSRATVGPSLGQPSPTSGRPRWLGGRQQQAERASERPARRAEPVFDLAFCLRPAGRAPTSICLGPLAPTPLGGPTWQPRQCEDKSQSKVSDVRPADCQSDLAAET